MTLLAINWLPVGTKILQFILSFSILVVLHEMGHFLPARWFKCRVEKFYLFFNPWFSLFKKKIGDTEYGLGWIPFGGYVKISGMIDESMDKDQMNQPAQPWEFRSKPAWQRLIIMLGGVTVNVLLAFVIFIMIAWVWGDTYIPVKNLKYGLHADSLGRRMGLQDGDNIIAVADTSLVRAGTEGTEMIMNEAKTVTVLRNGQRVVLNVPPGLISQLNKNRLGGLDYVRYPIVVDTLKKDIKILNNVPIFKNDTLVKFDGHPVKWMYELSNRDTFGYLQKEKRTRVTMDFKRGSDTVHVELAYDPETHTNVGFKAGDQILGDFHQSYTLLQAIPRGIHKSIQTLSNYIKNLKLLFTSKEVKVQDSLGSVISITSVFPSSWDWESFWSLTGIFSILLAFMNVLPIPALDGGHALFTLVEIISGRKPSDKFIEYAQMVGMILLFALMAYALGLDILGLFRGR